MLDVGLSLFIMSVINLTVLNSNFNVQYGLPGRYV